MAYDYAIDDNKYNSLVAIIENKCNENDRLSRMYFKVSEALKNYDGKQINIRIEKACILEGYKVSYYKGQYSHKHLNITKEVIDDEGYRKNSEHYTIYLTEEREQKILDVKYLIKKANNLKEQVLKERQQAINICEVISKYNYTLQAFQQAKEELTKLPYFYEWDRRFY